MLVICAETTELCRERACPCARSIDIAHFYAEQPTIAPEAAMAVGMRKKYSIRCRKSIKVRGYLILYEDYKK